MTPPGALREGREAKRLNSPGWGWLKRALTAIFFAAVAVFTVRYAQNVDWPQVWASIRGTPAGVLALAVALAAASHAMVSSFDLLGRYYTGHHLPAARVMGVNFISYAFNLNMGALVGGVAFRFRLYSRLGLDNPTITRVLSLSVLTNWLGYLAVGGAVFTFVPLPLPPAWKLDSAGLHFLGIALLLGAALYMALCFWSPRRSMRLRSHELLLPPARMATVQLAISSINWLVMGGILHTLLRGEVAFLTVLMVLLVAAVAGVITHVPAGLGVLEAVFIALLSHRIAEPQLIAALLTYRAIYYIAPLGAAAVLYLLFETRVASRNS
jgi:glycosyltransferase 2 family protein